MIVYCSCETPVMNAEYDAGCRRCGNPVDFTPPQLHCSVCQQPPWWSFPREDDKCPDCVEGRLVTSPRAA